MSRITNGSDKPFEIADNVLKGREYEYPANNWGNLGRFVIERLRSNPDFIGQIDGVSDKKDTYEEMRDRSVRCALWMRKEGIRRGDVVTICAPSQLDLAMPCFACQYIGAAFNPLDAGMNVKDVSHMMSITRPKMAFASELTAPVVAAAAKRCDLTVKVVVFGKSDRFYEFDSVISEANTEEVENFSCDILVEPEDTAYIMSSSGTTGLPKGIAITHRASIRQFHAWSSYWNGERRCLVYSTVYWITGTFGLFFSLYSNMTSIVPPPFTEKITCELVEKYEINWILVNTSMCNRLLKSGSLNSHDTSSVKRVLCGGGHMSSESHVALRRSIPTAVISLIYGMTEASGFMVATCPNAKPGSCGYILDNGQLKVLRVNTSRKLGPNESGELCFKLPTVMKYYYNDPKATAKTIDEEGWLHTGDLGYYDEDGEIFVVARLKELIKYRNYQIPPREIEAIVLSHSGVKEVAVVGAPHPEDDEHPVAFVVKSGIVRITEKEIIDLVASELTDTKRLRGGVRFLEELPRTPTDKLKLGELRKLAKLVAVRKENGHG